MSNIPKVFENGIQLSEREKDLIQDEAQTVSDKLLELFEGRPDRAFNYGELILLFERQTGRRWSKDTIAARLSELSGSNDDYRDSNGQFPLVKLDKKRKNPLGRIEIHLYSWNPNYGQPTEQTELGFEERLVV